MVTSTATGSPKRVPGTNRHCFAGHDRLLVESEVPIERPDDGHVADRAIRQDDGLEQDGTLDLGAHRLGRVFWLALPDDLRYFDAVTRSVHAAAGAATLTGAQPVALP